MLYEHAISSDGSIVWCKCSDQIKFSIELKHDFIEYILSDHNIDMSLYIILGNMNVQSTDC